MRIIVDRIEGEFVVAELPDKTMLSVPLRLFPDAAEGNVYDIIKNTDETADRLERINEKFNRLKK
jgi:hypothetical protein